MGSSKYSNDEEFDFGKISGKAKRKVPKSKKPSPPDEETGFILTLHRSKKGKKGFIFKDLGYCTGAEFLEWASEVYPIDLKSEDPKRYNTYLEKIRALKNIMNYHKQTWHPNNRSIIN